jgi:hypothetical protein
MKKSLSLLLSVGAFFFVFSFVFAQAPEAVSLPKASLQNNVAKTAVPAQDFFSPTVRILNTKIVSQKDRDFVLSFDISNNGSLIQPGIKYALYLEKNCPQPQQELLIKNYMMSL